MRSPPRPWRQPLSVPATGPAADTEGGRAFFQERLAIWAKVGFLLTFSFFVLENLLPLCRSSRFVVRRYSFSTSRSWSSGERPGSPCNGDQSPVLC